MTQKQRPGARGQHAPSPPSAEPATPNPIAALYQLLSDPSFAIFVIIALAVASILGIVVIDQVPFRGEMARMRFQDQADDPLVWFLVNIVPERPFRSLLFRTLLALLSLSLLACVIKRWRSQWRLAFKVPQPERGAFDGSGAVVWRTSKRPASEELKAFLKRRWFALREGGADDELLLGGNRLGVARLGSVLTHVGFLLLVVGGLVMASTGTAGMVWLSPGESVWIPGTDAQLHLEDFRIETTPQGQIKDYVSSVRLVREDAPVREMEIEVNKPLRYRGRSVYQTSYRAEPDRVRSLTLVYDMPVPGTSPGAGADDADRSKPSGPNEADRSKPSGGEAGSNAPNSDDAPGGESASSRAQSRTDAGTASASQRPEGHPDVEAVPASLQPEGHPDIEEMRRMASEMGRGEPASPMGEPPAGSGMAMPPHESTGGGRFRNPSAMVLPAGERKALPGTPYSVEIDTFLVDFRVDRGGFRLGSAEPRNPAARLRFFESDSLIGSGWYFLFHPDMPVGSGPDLPIRLADYDPFMQTGLEVATHPGSAWVWAGIAVMTLGTLLSFLLRHERIWLRVRPAAAATNAQAWELALVHTGASKQDPSLVKQSWESAITPLTARFLRRWPARGGRPDRVPRSDERAVSDQTETEPVEASV